MTHINNNVFDVEKELNRFCHTPDRYVYDCAKTVYSDDEIEYCLKKASLNKNTVPTAYISVILHSMLILEPAHKAGLNIKKLFCDLSNLFRKIVRFYNYGNYDILNYLNCLYLYAKEQNAEYIFEGAVKNLALNPDQVINSESDAQLSIISELFVDLYKAGLINYPIEGTAENINTVLQYNKHTGNSKYYEFCINSISPELKNKVLKILPDFLENKTLLQVYLLSKILNTLDSLSISESELLKLLTACYDLDNISSPNFLPGRGIYTGKLLNTYTYLKIFKTSPLEDIPKFFSLDSGKITDYLFFDFEDKTPKELSYFETFDSSAVQFFISIRSFRKIPADYLKEALENYKISNFMSFSELSAFHDTVICAYIAGFPASAFKPNQLCSLEINAICKIYNLDLENDTKNKFLFYCQNLKTGEDLDYARGKYLNILYYLSGEPTVDINAWCNCLTADISEIDKLFVARIIFETPTEGELSPKTRRHFANVFKRGLAAGEFSEFEFKAVEKAVKLKVINKNTVNTYLNLVQGINAKLYLTELLLTSKSSATCSDDESTSSLGHEFDI